MGEGNNNDFSTDSLLVEFATFEFAILPVRYVLLLSVNHFKYFLNPTRKKLLIYFLFFYACPSDGAKGRGPSLLVANLNMANLTRSENGVKQSFPSFLTIKIIIHT